MSIFPRFQRGPRILTVDEPVEDTARARSDTHVCERREERAEDEGHKRETVLSNFGENLRSVTRQGETVYKEIG